MMPVKPSSVNRHKAHDLDEKERTADVEIGENASFSDLQLSKNVLEGLQQSGFYKPSPIQLKAIPVGKFGLDLIVQAKSGTGKTCVFSVIALEMINTSVSNVQALILAPTREIAVQIQSVIQSIGCAFASLKCHTFIGGTEVKTDVLKLRKCHVAIGSPGRIKQLIEEDLLNTNHVALFVLDEADELLKQLEHKEVINWIYYRLPAYKQMIAASATYPEAVAAILQKYMKSPKYVRLDSDQPALLGIKQYYKAVQHHPLSQKLVLAKVQKIIKILSRVHFGQCLIFTNYQTKAESLCNTLNNRSWTATHMSSLQTQAERLRILQDLQEGKCRILVTTDLTARGIDAKNVDLVINFEVPWRSDVYYHRIGRAGRYGSFGAAVNIVSDGKELMSLLTIAKACDLSIRRLPAKMPKNLPHNMSIWKECEDLREVFGVNVDGRNAVDDNNGPTKGVSGADDKDITITPENIDRNQQLKSETVKEFNTLHDSLGRSLFKMVRSAQASRGAEHGDQETDVVQNEVFEHSMDRLVQLVGDIMKPAECPLFGGGGDVVTSGDGLNPVVVGNTETRVEPVRGEVGRNTGQDWTMEIGQFDDPLFCEMNDYLDFLDSYYLKLGL